MEATILGYILGRYTRRDSGKENGSCYNRVHIGAKYRDNGNYNGNYYIEFGVLGSQHTSQLV